MNLVGWLGVGFGAWLIVAPIIGALRDHGQD